MDSLLNKIISERLYSFKHQGPFQDMIIDVTLPELKDKPLNVWSDWGPMYSFKLCSDYPISLKFRDEHGRELNSYDVFVPSLSIESPIDGRTREDYPLFISIPLRERRSKIELFFNPQAELSEVRVKKGTNLSDSLPLRLHG